MTFKPAVILEKARGQEERQENQAICWVVSGEAGLAKQILWSFTANPLRLLALVVTGGRERISKRSGHYIPIMTAIFFHFDTSRMHALLCQGLRT